MRDLVDRSGYSDQILVDSAGTHAYHTGEKADGRSRAKAIERGMNMEDLRARKISINDYDEFDYILAMDEDNLDLINYYAPESPKAEVALFLSYANGTGLTSETVVPDPYYGGAAGFDHVFDLVELGCKALLEHVRGSYELK